MRHIQSVFVLVLVGSAAALLAAQAPPGTPYDLVLRGGLYARLAAMQFDASGPAAPPPSR